MVSVLEESVEFCFGSACDDVNGWALPLHLVKRERHEEVSFMVRKIFGFLNPFRNVT